MGQQSDQRRQKLDYIRSMLTQLHAMAGQEKCDMLCYLIEMACIEASDLITDDLALKRPGDKRDSAA